ncbi:basic proline-rich protein-like [Lepus europaeus]|uniref:basic proline-rich protein-like n=1 Tax=Lepus europaeus TaxID=9983 RepID=UPI002B4733B1|nr:basic proline-rich protein-like [Lepus europaeus]
MSFNSGNGVDPHQGRSPRRQGPPRLRERAAEGRGRKGRRLGARLRRPQSGAGRPGTHRPRAPAAPEPSPDSPAVSGAHGSLPRSDDPARKVTLPSHLTGPALPVPHRGRRPRYSPPERRPSPPPSLSPPPPGSAVRPLRGSARPPHAPRPPRSRALPPGDARQRAGARPLRSVPGREPSQRSHWLPGPGARDVSRWARFSHSCGSRRRARPCSLSHSPTAPTPSPLWGVRANRGDRGDLAV